MRFRLRDVLSKDWAARNNSNRLEPEERPDDLDIELKLGSAPVEKEPAAVLNEVPDTAAEQVVVKKADDTAHTDLAGKSRRRANLMSFSRQLRDG